MADTIAAVATPPGCGGIGILRLSGPAAIAIAEGIAGPRLGSRRAIHRAFAGADGRVIDDGIVIVFPGPASYTGEDVVELQGHGSPVLLRELQDTALRLGARAARPGEFTERAFLNGRMDLAQAEAVADLIHAQTAAAAKLARSSMDGALARELEPIGAAIRDQRVLIEAEIDFGETDLESTVASAVVDRAAGIAEDLEQLARRLRPARLFTAGMRLALVGAPNVGKSSLMNRLADAPVAIVTEIPGTTRDVLRAPIAIDGLPVELIDTAGLRDTVDPVERMGVERALEAVRSADLVLEVRDLTRPDLQVTLPELPGVPVLRAWNKADQVDLAAVSVHGPCVSALTGEGLGDLQKALRAAIGLTDSGEGRFSVRARHLEGLEAAAAHLRAIRSGVAPDLIAEELRLAERALEELLGRADPEALLGAIFAGFCIGK